MEQFDTFMRMFVERGIIYGVGVVVMWRALRQFLSKNGKVKSPSVGTSFSREFYEKMAGEQMKNIVSSAIKGQAQLCNQTFVSIKEQLMAGDTRMSELSEKQDHYAEENSKQGQDIMRAIGRLEGRLNGGSR